MNLEAAIRANDHLEVTRLLALPHVDPNGYCEGDDIFPLFLASDLGYPEIVQLLLQHSANVNQRTANFGPTSLHKASLNGHVTIVSILLAHGANIHLDLTDTADMKPLGVASHYGHEDCAVALLVHGANANLPVVHMPSPLYRAVQHYDIDMARLLLVANADANQPAGPESTPLLWAATFFDHRLVALLLEHGANADTPRDSRRSPLFVAAYRGNPALVSTLLAYRADPSVPREKVTPLQAATQRGNLEVVDLLHRWAEHTASHLRMQATALCWLQREGEVEIPNDLLSWIVKYMGVPWPPS